MLLSVVVIFYNQKRLVHRALRSVVRQTYADLDIVVVDDGSDESIENEVKRFGDSRIRFFRKKNGGPASARNLGIKEARGHYIAFLDGDDVFLPQKIERMVSFLGFLQPFANSLEQTSEEDREEVFNRKDRKERKGIDGCREKNGIGSGEGVYSQPRLQMNVSTGTDSAAQKSSECSGHRFFPFRVLRVFRGRNSLPLGCSSSGSGCGQSPLLGQDYPVCIVTSDAYVVDEKNRFVGRLRSQSYAPGEIIDTAVLRPSLTLYHKQIFEKTVRFPETLKTGEDGAFNIIATQHVPVLRVPEPLVLYRITESGLARQHLVDYEMAVDRTKARVSFVSSHLSAGKAAEYERLAFRGLLDGFLSAGNLPAAKKWANEVDASTVSLITKFSIRSGINFYLFARRIRRGISLLWLLPVQARLKQYL